MNWPRIETERLVLRGWRADDFDAYAQMSADDETMRYISRGGAGVERDEAWRLMAMIIGHQALRGYSFFAVEEKASGHFVGRVGPWMPEGWPELEIGWAIERSRWGRGYATEAARGAAGWVHRELGAGHVIHFIDPENARSISVAERLGARRTGSFMLFGTMNVDVWRTELPLA